MQTSKKILLTLTGILLALFVSSLMILRNDTQEVFEERAMSNPLTAVPVREFKTLVVSGLWDITVRQGRVQRVEVAFDKEENYLPQLRQSGDTLYLSIKGDSTAVVNAKIVTPVLEGVEANDGASVTLTKFKKDSISIKLRDSYFSDKENEFVHVFYQTEGQTRIDFVDDPFQ